VKQHGVAPPGKRTIHPLLSKALHLFFLLTRPLTMGARAIVVNAQQEVLLVKHRYESGWQLPGGGIEIGESALDALRREVREEAGVEILGQPQLVGSFHNRDVSVRDHVLVYRCDRFELGRREQLSGEIAQCAFFPLHALPEDTTPGTRRRLAECFDGHELEASW
jgi:ADP-ribose pyrophosphatase YjhB (NUDIX family)